jgi:hypothetical protein
MSSINELKEDLGFVAGAVRRGEEGALPSLFILWSILTPVGFALADFAPLYCGLYWLVVGPAGGVASWWIGRRTALRTGQIDRKLGRRYGLHWLVIGVAYVLIAANAMTGHMNAGGAISSFMLLTAIAYTLAGVHLSRTFLASGLVLFAGYVALVWLPLQYVWTTTGLIFAVAMLAGAFQSRASAGAEHDAG